MALFSRMGFSEWSCQNVPLHLCSDRKDMLTYYKKNVCYLMSSDLSRSRSSVLKEVLGCFGLVLFGFALFGL